jgi:PKD repeat protein
LLLLGALVAATLNLNLSVAPAGADTAPADPSLETVTAAALPTVQINGVVWAEVIVGNRVYATGKFTSARPAGAASGTNETARSNILAFDLTTGNLITSWAPTLNAQGLAITASEDGSTIYVGGDFDRVNNVSRGRVAAINAQTGALVTGFTAAANTRVASLAVHGSTLYVGGYFTTFGGQTRTRLAAVDTGTGAVLPWAPAADREVLSMVVHPASGRVIVGGNFNTLNGSTQLGMGSLDGTTGAVMPWAANTVVKNHDDSSAISALTTDGDTIFGTGWAYFGGGATANFEGVFAADPLTGALKWIDGGRGDNYGIAVTGNVLYTVGHPHDWGMLDWNPQTDPLGYQRTMAIDKRATPGLTNAFGTSDIWQPFKGMQAAQPLHWLPTISGGTYTGQNQGAWSVATNGAYVVEGGEFPKVNGKAQQGLVRFAKRAIAGSNVDPVQGFNELAPKLTPLGPGTVRIGWTAAWDRDNANLEVEVLRGSTVIDTFTTDTKWWNRPLLGFTDRSAPPGSSQTYRIRVTDPYGNGFSGPTATVTVPAGSPTASPYADSVRADHPDWEWRLGETSGTTAYDHGGSNDLTLSSAAVRNQAGALLNEPDAATGFPGTSSTSTVQGASPYWQGGPQTFSLEAWFKTTTTTGGKIVGFGDSRTGRSTSNGNDRAIYMANNGQLRFGVRPDMGTRQTIVSPATYRDGQWHQVVGTLSGDGMKLYVDGNLVASNASVTRAQVYRGYWRVGGDNLGSWPSAPSREAITATLDEVAVYPTALPLDRVRAHYDASGRSGVPTNTPPVASFTTGVQDRTATFTSTSFDPDGGSITSSAWTFGDGATGTGTSDTHTYAADGSYTVTLTVTDDGDATDTSTQLVTIGTPTVLAADSFERTVTNGFGTADLGGPWSLTGPATSFSVSGGAGRIAGALSSDRAAYLTGPRQRDVDITADISLDRTATGGGAYVSVIGRRVSNGNDYRLKLRYVAGGSVAAFLTRTVGGAETVLASTTVPGLAVNPADVLQARFQVSGSTSTTARAKVWRAGASEPPAWTLSNTAAAPVALQSAGDLGVLVYISGSWSGPAPVVAVDDLQAAVPPPG